MSSNDTSAEDEKIIITTDHDDDESYYNTTDSSVSPAHDTPRSKYFLKYVVECLQKTTGDLHSLVRTTDVSGMPSNTLRKLQKLSGELEGLVSIMQRDEEKRTDRRKDSCKPQKALLKKCHEALEDIKRCSIKLMSNNETEAIKARTSEMNAGAAVFVPQEAQQEMTECQYEFPPEMISTVQPGCVGETEYPFQNAPQSFMPVGQGFHPQFQMAPHLMMQQCSSPMEYSGQFGGFYNPVPHFSGHINPSRFSQFPTTSFVSPNPMIPQPLPVTSMQNFPSSMQYPQQPPQHTFHQQNQPHFSSGVPQLQYSSISQGPPHSYQNQSGIPVQQMFVHPQPQVESPPPPPPPPPSSQTFEQPMHSSQVSNGRYRDQYDDSLPSIYQQEPDRDESGRYLPPQRWFKGGIPRHEGPPLRPFVIPPPGHRSVRPRRGNRRRSPHGMDRPPYHHRYSHYPRNDLPSDNYNEEVIDEYMSDSSCDCEAHSNRCCKSRVHPHHVPCSQFRGGSNHRRQTSTTRKVDAHSSASCSPGPKKTIYHEQSQQTDDIVEINPKTGTTVIGNNTEKYESSQPICSSQPPQISNFSSTTPQLLCPSPFYFYPQPAYPSSFFPSQPQAVQENPVTSANEVTTAPSATKLVSEPAAASTQDECASENKTSSFREKACSPLPSSKEVAVTEVSESIEVSSKQLSMPQPIVQDPPKPQRPIFSSENETSLEAPQTILTLNSDDKTEGAVASDKISPPPSMEKLNNKRENTEGEQDVGTTVKIVTGGYAAALASKPVHASKPEDDNPSRNALVVTSSKVVVKGPVQFNAGLSEPESIRPNGDYGRGRGRGRNSPSRSRGSSRARTFFPSQRPPRIAAADVSYIRAEERDGWEVVSNKSHGPKLSRRRSSRLTNCNFYDGCWEIVSSESHDPNPSIESSSSLSNRNLRDNSKYEENNQNEDKNQNETCQLGRNLKQPCLPAYTAIDSNDHKSCKGESVEHKVDPVKNDVPKPVKIENYEVQKPKQQVTFYSDAAKRGIAQTKETKCTDKPKPPYRQAQPSSGGSKPSEATDPVSIPKKIISTQKTTLVVQKTTSKLASSGSYPVPASNKPITPMTNPKHCGNESSKLDKKQVMLNESPIVYKVLPSVKDRTKDEGDLLLEMNLSSKRRQKSKATKELEKRAPLEYIPESPVKEVPIKSTSILDGDNRTTTNPKSGAEDLNDTVDNKQSGSTIDLEKLADSPTLSDPEVKESVTVDQLDAAVMHEYYAEIMEAISWDEQMVETGKIEKIISLEKSDPLKTLRLGSFDFFSELIKKYPNRAEKVYKSLLHQMKLREAQEKSDAKIRQVREKRQQLLQDKTAKMRELVQKVEEVKAAQYQLALLRKSRIESKLKKAEENRKMHLSIIRRKAHDEEEKLREIAFINELEAQNRRHDSLVLRQEHEERIQYLIEERLRKLEEKAAKEAAVEERKRLLEAERKEKLERLREKRRQKEEIIGRKQQEREQERLEIAREKAREREERLLARQALQLASAEELQKRIQQKQQESARRHEESIEQIRQKALEIGLHRMIDEYTNNYYYFKTGDAKQKQAVMPSGEKLKAMKKRAKRIKSRMAVRASEFLDKFIFPDPNPQSSRHILKYMSEWSDFLECISVDFNEHQLSQLDAILSDIETYLGSCDKKWFRDCRGLFHLGTFMKSITNAIGDSVAVNLLKCIRKVASIYLICSSDLECIDFIVGASDIASFIEILKITLTDVYVKRNVEITDIIFRLLKQVFDNYMNKDVPSHISMRLQDTISYMICSGTLYKLMAFYSSANVESTESVKELIPISLELLSSLLTKAVNPSEYLNLLVSTDILGTMPLLYEGLQQDLKATPLYSIHIFKLLLSFASSDMELFQKTLGGPGMSLQFRSITSLVMNICISKNNLEELLHTVIEIVGYFSFNNRENQDLIQSGQTPTVLQQLVHLPFKYYCEPKYMAVLFPTIICCTNDNPTNTAIIENEMSMGMITDFIKTDAVNASNIFQTLLQPKKVPTGPLKKLKQSKGRSCSTPHGSVSLTRECFSAEADPNPADDTISSIESLPADPVTETVNESENPCLSSRTAASSGIPDIEICPETTLVKGSTEEHVMTAVAEERVDFSDKGRKSEKLQTKVVAAKDVFSCAVSTLEADDKGKDIPVEETSKVVCEISLQQKELPNKQYSSPTSAKPTEAPGPKNSDPKRVEHSETGQKPSTVKFNKKSKQVEKDEGTPSPATVTSGVSKMPQQTSGKKLKPKKPKTPSLPVQAPAVVNLPEIPDPPVISASS